MPDYVAWQTTVQDDAGNAVVQPSVEVRHTSNSQLATIYADAAGTALSNPFTGLVDGFAQFYVEGGVYDITASKGGSTQSWEVNIISFLETNAATQNWLDDADLGTTANITLSGEQTIDGTLTSASRVLVKDQTTATENGVYVSAAGAWTRATDADTDAEIARAYIRVSGGTANAGKRYAVAGAPSIGVNDINFDEFGPSVDLAAHEADLANPHGTTLSQVVTTEEGAKIAGIAVAAESRGGDNIDGMGGRATGTPATMTALDASITSTVDADLGAALSVSVDEVVAPVQSVPISAGQVYRAKFRVKRTSDPVDEAVSTVTCGLQWLNEDHSAAGQTIVETMDDLTIALGEVVLEATFSKDHAAADNTISASVIYARPFVQTIGTDHTTLVGTVELVAVSPGELRNAGKVGFEGIGRANPGARRKENSIVQNIASPTVDIQWQPLFDSDVIELSGASDFDCSYLIPGQSLTILSTTSVNVFAGHGFTFYGQGTDNQWAFTGNSVCRVTRWNAKIVLEEILGSGTFSTITEPTRGVNILNCGQSQSVRFHQHGGIGGFHRALRDASWSGSAYEKDIRWIDGGTEGAALDERSNASNYFWDDVLSAAGPAMTTATDAITASTVTPDYVFWTQGEADVGAVASGAITVSQLTLSIGDAWDHLRANGATGATFIVNLLGAHETPGADDGAAGVREAYLNAIAAKSYAHQGADVFDLSRSLYGDVHLDRAAQAAFGFRMARSWLNVEETLTLNEGPTLTGAVLSTNKRSVTLSFTTADTLWMPEGDWLDGEMAGPAPFGFAIIAATKNSSFTPIIPARRGYVSGLTIILEADQDLTGCTICPNYGYLAHARGGNFVRDRDADAYHGVPGLPLRTTLPVAVT